MNKVLSRRSEFFFNVPVSLAFKRDSVGFVDDLPSSHRNIFRYLYNFRTWSGVRIKNETIARATGFSRKSVQRATSYFMSRGILRKEQEHTYSLNAYDLAPCIVKGKPGYDLWLSYLPEKLAQLYLRDGLLPNKGVEKSLSKGNVPLYISKRVSSKLYNKVYETRACVRGTSHTYQRQMHGSGRYSPYHDDLHLLTMKKRKRYLLGDTVVSGSGSNLADIDHSKIKEGIVSEFDLKGSDWLKLFAFEDSVLSAMYERYCLLKSQNLKRDYDWFIEQCIDYLGAQQQKPNWSRFYSLCKRLHVGQKKKWGSKKEEKVQSTTERMRAQQQRTTTVGPRKFPLKFLYEDLRKYQVEVAKFKETADNPFKEALIAMSEKRMRDIKREIEERTAAGERP